MSNENKTWLEKLDEKLVDEFHFVLKEVIYDPAWMNDTGIWINDIFGFFDYFENLVNQINNLADKPSHLQSFLNDLNPTGKQYSQSGEATMVAKASLPVTRLKVIVYNALLIKFDNLAKFDDSLIITVRILGKLLHREIVKSINHLAVSLKEERYYLLANRLEQSSSLTNKANAIKNFLDEVLLDNNIKKLSDKRDAIFFMKEELETPFQTLAKRRGRGDYSNHSSFGDDWNLQSFCSLVYFEYYRITALHRLSFAQHKVENDNSNVFNSEESIKKNTNNFTLRQKVFILMLLTFRRLDRPEDITQERIVELFHGLVGGDIKKIRKLLKHPTDHTDSPQSIKLLCNDLHFVRDELGKIGNTEHSARILSEIDFLKSDLEG